MGTDIGKIKRKCKEEEGFNSGKDSGVSEETKNRKRYYENTTKITNGLIKHNFKVSP